MNARQGRGHREGAERRRRFSALLSVAALGLTALVLGPLAAFAAAGSGSPASTGPGSRSGGQGLITVSSTGVSATVGTTTILAPQTSTVPGGTTTATTCSEPVVGTVSSTTPTPGTGSATTSTTGAGGAALSTTTATATAPATTTVATTPAGTGSGARPSSGSRSSCQVSAPTTIATPAGNPYAKRGMWIWELPATDGGSVSRIVAQARHYGIGTLYIKSGDGTGLWSQFTPGLVRRLHAAGFDVCAWQYIYGNAPRVEAQVGADSVRDGADCLVLDAESEYQSKYVQAQTFMGALRAQIGARFPVALAGLPYIDYHPSFPYSVFLGANGAQYDLPQMYWQDIGTTVAAVYAHTYAFNELYRRPIDPLGQIFDSPPAASVRAFRSIGLAYHAPGINWWDFQAAGSAQLNAIAATAAPIRGFKANTTVASVGRGAVGDIVVLAQEHLWNTHERVTIDGGFGAKTQRAVAAFQAGHGLAVSGVITPQTWSRLLTVPIPRVRWVAHGRSVFARVISPSA